MPKLRHLYSLLFYLLSPLVLLRLLYRSLREPDYRRAPLERLGFFQTKATGPVLWIHAVSAGEMNAAAPLVKRLLALGHNCLVTNTTPAGRERCQSLLGNVAEGAAEGSVENCYAPYDLPGSVKRFLRRNNPTALIIVDTELWPNMIHCCAERGIKTILVNGRLSAKSAAGYGRLRGLSARMMGSLDIVAVQTDAHAERFVALGAEASRVHVTGSIKFDGAAAMDAAAKAEALQARLGCPCCLLLAASTHPG
ncbi:MAG: 3-deoxy-D-manno-octulosonic acid transferase, partial [Pseudomonadales bacterium]